MAIATHSSRWTKNLIWVVSLIGLGVPSQAHSAIPSRLLSSGMVFPSLDSAVTDGPQTLSFSPDESAIGLSGSLSSYPTFIGNYAHATKSFSYGLGYAARNYTQSYYYTPLSYQHWTSLAACFRYDKLSLGATLAANVVALSTGPQVSFGIGYGGIRGTTFAIFLPNILQVAPMVGIGYIDPELYSLEFSVALPSLIAMSSASLFTLSVGVTTYIKTFGLSFTASNAIGPSALYLAPSYTLGGSFRITKKIAITAKLDTISTATVGATFGFQ